MSFSLLKILSENMNRKRLRYAAVSLWGHTPQSETVAQGVVSTFDTKAGSGMIASDDGNEDIFFNFTAIPDEEYRILEAGTPVIFEVIKGNFSQT